MFLVFQKGEGRDDVFKAYGDENMTIAELFEKTKWPKEDVNFEFDGEDCTRHRVWNSKKLNVFYLISCFFAKKNGFR